MSTHPKIVELLELLGCCVEAVGVLLRVAVAVLAGLVTLAAVIAMLANAPTPSWRCGTMVSETVRGTTYTYCGD